MFYPREIRLVLFVIVLTLLAQSGCLLVPDRKEGGITAPNVPPTLRITSGAATPGSDGIDYRVHFEWAGSDVDGVIRGYRWAMDDTVSVGAWRDTTGASARLNVRAATPEPESDSLFADWHTFFAQATDNESATSELVRYYFSARNIAPRSWITAPDYPNHPLLLLQRTTVVTWDGEDLDSPWPEHQPAAYECKLVRLSTIPDVDRVYVDSLRNGRNLLDSLGYGSRTRWTRVPSTTHAFALRNLVSGEYYAFGVRAIDEAGAVEPALDHNRNYIVFAVAEWTGQPVVTINEPSLGAFTFPREGDVWDVNVIAGRPIRFRWTGDASSYGGRAGKVNYGLDVPDPGDESDLDPRGIGGFRGWGNWEGNDYPFVFGPEEAGTVHYFYVFMRDESDAPASTRRCVVRIKVLAFAFDKFGLVVDDARFQSGVSDLVHDAFLDRTLLRRFRDLGGVDNYSIWPATNESGQSPSVLRIEDLARYQNIAWSCNIGSNINSGIGDSRNEAILQSYLNAGGNLFIFGGRLAGMNQGQLDYPFYPRTDDAGRDKLYFKFLYMQRKVVSCRDREASTCYQPMSGLYAARSRNAAYPDLALDTAKWDPWQIPGSEYRGGIAQWEGVMRAEGAEPEHREGLDTLYTAQTWNRSLNPRCEEDSSSANGAIIGAHYQPTAADTLAGRQHGRIVYLNFQPWWFQEGTLLDTGTAAVNWLVTGRDW